jgi:hypothetical protein
MPNAACECNSQIVLALARGRPSPDAGCNVGIRPGDPTSRSFTATEIRTRAEILLYCPGLAPIAGRAVFRRLQNFHAGTN